MKQKLLLAFLLSSGIISETFAQAELQVIHNCADPAAASVDVYVNGALALDDFTFRSATPFLTLSAGVTLNIGIAPGNSTSVNDTLVNIPVTLADGQRYVAVASGVLNPAAFSANPDGASTGFQLLIADNIRTSSLNAGEVDLKVLHGSTDAPTVDVVAQNVATLVDDAAYTNFTNYISVPAGDYLLDITPGNSSSVVATFSAELNGLGGGAAVVFASGFLNPSANQNGPAFGLFAALPNGAVAALSPVGTARLQVIHNAADPAAETVDVYVNGGLLLDNFTFRTATPFIDVNSGQTLNIGIAPGNSSSANDTLVNIPVVLADGQTYVAVANGVLAPAGFAANPSGLSTGFQLLLFNGMKEAATNVTDVDLAVLHGATDAPAVDVYARGVAQLIDNIDYGQLQGYVSVPPSSYLLDITPAAGSPILLTYSADLSGLAGGAGVVFASGFLSPSTNQNGEGFGLFVALPNGTVLALNETSNARLQVIHNCADPAASTVDVYLNGSLALDDFAFRTATPYIDVPAGVTINIGIAPGNSTSADDTLVNIPAVFSNGETYSAIASGVLNPAAFASNPNGVGTGFQLLVANAMREAALNSNEVDFRVLHGATDAPAVDVVARGVATLVNNAAYTDFTGYISVPANPYIIDIKAAGTSTIVASYSAPLNLVPGGAGVVFASGFLNPSANQNGPAFGLYAALPDGSVIALPAVSQARLQVIHNCADPVADSVDVYLNGALLLDNFAFRTATPYIDFPAGTVQNVGIAPKTSVSANDTLVNYSITAANGETYVAIASGVLTPGSFASNPDGRPTGFTLLLQDQQKESAGSATDVEFRVLHGSTDAPTVDVVAVGAGVIVDNAGYLDYTNYINVPAASYTLQVTPGNNNSIIVAQYTADLSGLGGGAAVVFASGFLNPATNQNGPAFGVYAALPNGTVVAFPVATGIAENNSSIRQVYPNPASSLLNIELKDEQRVMGYTITDMSGKIVAEDALSMNSNRLTVNTSLLEAGMYLLNLQTSGGNSTARFQVIK